MGQQMMHGDSALVVGYRADELAHRIGHAQLAHHLQLQDRRGGELLGHRHDVVGGVAPGGNLRGAVGEAEAPAVRDLVPAGGDYRAAGPVGQGIVEKLLFSAKATRLTSELPIQPNSTLRCRFRLAVRGTLAQSVCSLGTLTTDNRPLRRYYRWSRIELAKEVFRMATYVLVGGAWLGGWCWKPIVRHLRDQGHDAYPVTLTGLGERVHLASHE